MADLVVCGDSGFRWPPGFEHHASAGRDRLPHHSRRDHPATSDAFRGRLVFRGQVPAFVALRVDVRETDDEASDRAGSTIASP